MKKIILTTAFLSVLFSACNTGTNATAKINQQNLEKAEKLAQEANRFPQMTFEKLEHDFGKIKPGTAVETIFKFKNTGDAPLVITDATSSCGCTVPEKPTQPIAPGDSGEIKVHFNGSGKDLVTKTVTVTANTESGSQLLTIKALVQD
ncbi:DUF1573 domain-containing protein [Capnocytophaga catalasegens]|uniref:DUF1573 domain-containing protein n=1 Tax=Capnocytophaga catalasegens TaxID=1004260 RepID=A0AAV5AYN7_9FLAO|nr:DUF1573 domain-containing protein [Capnocytophaga catalasegens]GIZ15594.1 hypothetical protein RCZ03_15940 [Capnocytophaga catalasegens]GJM50193.1 hypothetical protein RCZ15_11670 [Capnocytophaga catalasegens]GJM52044.1 hypothetical protein RCZ16_03620 [Capnocytophaga catalasegens]